MTNNSSDVSVDFEDEVEDEARESIDRLNQQHDYIKRLPDVKRVEMTRRLDELVALEKQAMRIWQDEAIALAQAERAHAYLRFDQKGWLILCAVIVLAAMLLGEFSIWTVLVVVVVFLVGTVRLPFGREKQQERLRDEKRTLVDRWAMAGNNEYDLGELRQLFEVSEEGCRLKSRVAYDRWRWGVVQAHLYKLDG